jgi:hypothetical protein
VGKKKMKVKIYKKYKENIGKEWVREKDYKTDSTDSHILLAFISFSP